MNGCREFRRLALELLEQCYHQDDDKTLQLLTYELQNWGRQTCLSLAVIANNKVGSAVVRVHICGLTCAGVLGASVMLNTPG